jgi:hypothetical protein
MSDTRAAIRELRSLSEKRTLGTLTEAELARWMALRRQLGLPVEPPEPAPASPAPPPERPAAVQRVAAPLVPLAHEQGPSAPQPEPPPPAGAPQNGSHAASWEGSAPPGASPRSAPASEALPETLWAGPALDAPHNAAAPSWMGPALDAPAWSPLVSDIPTDPALDELPPVPFDEAPPARPLHGIEGGGDFGGRADEPVPLAPAADFVSYARQGTDALELPSASADAADITQGGLAELAAFPERSPPAATGDTPDERRFAEDPARTSFSEVQSPAHLEAVDAAAALEVSSGSPPAAPFESSVPSESGFPDQGVLPEPPTPLQLEAVQPAEGGFPDEGVLPEPPTPLQLEAVQPAQGGFPDEGVLPEPPAPLQLENPSLLSGAVPVPFGSDLPVEAPVAPVPVSTWEPGAERPPVLGAEEFAQGGAPLNAGNLDPWPEGPPAAEEGVETVGDEDLVEATPLPAFPPPTPAGSGGIRGFQFPRPPGAMVVPVPPTSQTIPGTRTRDVGPGVPAGPAPTGSTQPVSRFQTPIPATPVAPSTPQPAARFQTPVSATAVAPSTPQPTARFQTPVSATAVAPSTPQPPTRFQTPVAPRPVTPSSQRQTSAPLKAPTPPPAPAYAAPPKLQPRQTREEEGSLPVLELVDEVEAPPTLLPQTREPVSTPTPAEGTGVFGPPTMLNPGFVEGDHRVVVHTLEGQVHRGTVHDLDLQDDVLAVAQTDGRSVRVPTRRVKAVFFVLSPGEKPPPARGERVQVTFRDGRQVVGYSEDHAAGEPGFFVVLSDARTNTARVYVYRGGIQSITAG